jgi:Amt family ammonium transporter
MLRTKVGERVHLPVAATTGRLARANPFGLKGHGVLGLAAILLASAPAASAAETTINSGDTAWLLTATALVLFMTIPGLALFYGGLVRTRNVLSILMQCLACTALITVLWVLYGYTIAFDGTGMSDGVVNLNSFIGSLAKFGMVGVTPTSVHSLAGTIPESVFSMFQLTFAIITPALILGAFAERMKFSAFMIFTGVWFTVVYLPVCHMVWGGTGSYIGSKIGALDFAGGTVVHINAGIAALVAALLIGKRKGYPSSPMPPHNLTMTVTGACMLWVGWFGFNAGSALVAGGQAGMAMLTTQVATAAAALTWAVIEWVKGGKPSALGISTGAVAGLVAITPASGTAGPLGALAIGLISGVACYLGATWVKRKFGYDDALDAFGVHGVGGFTGSILTGIFAAPALGGFMDGYPGFGEQLWKQTAGSVITLVYSLIASFIILKVIDVTMGLRVTPQQEIDGLDLTLHGERGYDL